MTRTAVLTDHCGGRGYVTNDGNGVLVESHAVAKVGTALRQRATGLFESERKAIAEAAHKRFSRKAVARHLKRAYVRTRSESETPGAVQ